MNTWTREEALEILKRAGITASHTTCDDVTSAAVLKMIEDQNLQPFDSGCSLHCCNEDFMIDGVHYSILREFGHMDSPTVQIVEPFR